MVYVYMYSTIGQNILDPFCPLYEDEILWFFKHLGKAQSKKFLLSLKPISIYVDEVSPRLCLEFVYSLYEEGGAWDILRDS